MTFEGRLLVVVLAAFAAGGLAGALAVRLARPARAGRDAAARADALLGLRLLPFAAGLAAAAAVAAAFVRFEPRGEVESTGVVLGGLAGGALALVALSAARLAAGWWRTRRQLGEWMRRSRPVDLPGAPVPAFAVDTAFPVVAVVGLLRPRLVIAESVLAACSEAELAAIAAHEARHVERRDNLRQAAVTAPPDVLALLPTGRRLGALWRAAAEEAADDAADRLGPTGRIDLAAALVRVARLAPVRRALDLPASALYRGEDLGPRVRRLLAGDPPPGRPGLRWGRALAATLVAAAAFGLAGIHALVEAAVRALP